MPDGTIIHQTWCHKFREMVSEYSAGSMKREMDFEDWDRKRIEKEKHGT